MRGAPDRPFRPVPTGAVYGTIIVMAVVASVSEDAAADPFEMLGAVVLSAFAFWLAHVYADVLSRRLSSPSGAFGEQLGASLRDAWPLLQTAGAPALALLLAGFGGLSRSAGVALALGLGLVQLFAWGTALARRHGRSGLRALASGLVNLGIGLLVVLLKALVH